MVLPLFFYHSFVHFNSFTFLLYLLILQYFHITLVLSLFLFPHSSTSSLYFSYALFFFAANYIFVVSFSYTTAESSGTVALAAGAPPHFRVRALKNLKRWDSLDSLSPILDVKILDLAR